MLMALSITICAKDKMVYEAHYGELPEVLIVFTWSRDTLNDDIDNLFAVDRRVVNTYTRLGFRLLTILKSICRLSIQVSCNLVSQAIKKRL